MELRQHLGVAILLILIFYVIWVFYNEKPKFHVPFTSGLIMWLIFEAFYWTIKLLIL